MCGRTSLFQPQPEIERRFSAAFTEEWVPQYNIAPEDEIPAVRNTSRDDINQLEWGLIPSWADDPDESPRPINARAETVAEKPMFQNAFEEQRCLIPADGFYEWKGERGHKQPYRVQRTDKELYAYAGLWETWSSNGDTRTSVTIITTDPNELVEPIHDRMPVILEPDEEGVWLTADDPDDLQELLDPFPAELLAAYPIAKKMNDPSYERPDVIEPIDIGEQSGLGEFG